MKVIGKITCFDESGSSGTDLYNGQIGDMVHAGKYVLGIKQNTGAFAIDINTDQVVRLYPIATVQGITQTADGNVWIASVVDGCARFTCIDPQTLDERDDMSVTFPSTVAYPTCSWGAWRNTPFVGSYSRNTIWFSVGGGIAGGSSKDKYYGWEVGSDPTLLKPVFDMAEADLTGSNARVKQKTYGTLRYDDRSGELIVMTVDDSSSGHYRYNWIHFINPTTGEILRTIALRPYYWFQAFAIFPDKFDAAINVDDITMDVSDGDMILDLTECVTDADNIDANIKLSLLEPPAVMAEDNATESHASVALDGHNLTISPISAGTHYFTLAAESNGRTISKTVTVNIGDITTGIEAITGNGNSIACDGQRMFINGFNGHKFDIFDVAGRNITSFDVDSDKYVFDFGSHNGIYIVTSDTDISTKVIIRK